MIQLNKNGWELVAGIVSVAVLSAGAIWLLKRKRPTEAELEQRRRQLLVQSGRIVDGMLLDLNELAAPDGGTLTMLLFNYRIGGVDYECSQDITTLLNVVDTKEMRAGFPASIRYETGNPQNSIILAETWSGLRSSLPVFPALEAQRRRDLGQLRPDRS